MTKKYIHFTYLSFTLDVLHIFIYTWSEDECIGKHNMSFSVKIREGWDVDGVISK